MENWGCVTFREVDLLIDERTASLANKQRVAVVVAHEIAHMVCQGMMMMMMIANDDDNDDNNQ